MVTSKAFDLGIMAMIILNIMVMATDTYDQSQQVANTLQTINLFFTILFTLEAVIKLFSLGVRQYYRVSTC